MNNFDLENIIYDINPFEPLIEPKQIYNLKSDKEKTNHELVEELLTFFSKSKYQNPIMESLQNFFCK